MTTSYDDDFLTRAELAATCGVSKRTIRRWEKGGKITPFKSAEGIFLFRVKDVAHVIGDRAIVHLKHARVHVPTGADASGELTAKVFDMLDAGMHPVNIIRTLRVNADVVEGLTARWLRWRRGIPLLSAHAVAIANSLHIMATRDATEFVHRIEAAAARLDRAMVCKSCKERRARMCGACHCARTEASVARVRERYGLPPPPATRPPPAEDDGNDDTDDCEGD